MPLKPPPPARSQAGGVAGASGGAMSVRKEAFEGLTARQKLTLFYNSSVSASEALSMDDQDISFDVLVRNGVKPVNFRAAGVKATTLKRLGVQDASQLRRLGFDALHLVDQEWCEEASAAYGAAHVIAAFLVSPQDAVALAGTEAVKTLNLNVEMLLEVCAGAPTEAVSVLKQVNDPSPLKGVRAHVILDAGLRSQQLKQLGYGLMSLRELKDVTTEEIRKLGFV